MFDGRLAEVDYPPICRDRKNQYFGLTLDSFFTLIIQLDEKFLRNKYATWGGEWGI